MHHWCKLTQSSWLGARSVFAHRFLRDDEFRLSVVSAGALAPLHGDFPPAEWQFMANSRAGEAKRDSLVRNVDPVAVGVGHLEFAGGVAGEEAAADVGFG
jgi:hypothetical protein